MNNNPHDLQVGDTLKLNYKVTGHFPSGFCQIQLIEGTNWHDNVSDIVRAPRVAAAGQVWRIRISQREVKIVYIDEDCVGLKFVDDPIKNPAVRHAMWSRSVWDEQQTKEYLRG